MHGQVHCLVEHGAVLERADNNSTRGSERTTGCQNPALVASLLKKGSKMGINTTLTIAAVNPPLGILYSKRIVPKTVKYYTTQLNSCTNSL